MKKEKLVTQEKYWITMEPSRRLRNVRSIGLLQIDDKIRYYTFIYSFQHYNRLETCMRYFHFRNFDAWNCVHTILLAYDIETSGPETCKVPYIDLEKYAWSIE